MLQQPVPKDYVLGTGKSHSVADFLAQALAALRLLNGTGLAVSTLEEWVEIDPRLLRVGEIHDARADATQARRDFGWKPNVGFPALVHMMLQADLKALAS